MKTDRQGKRGKRGKKGETGERGQGLDRRIIWAFIAVFVIAGLSLSAVGYQAVENQNAIHRIDRQAVSIEQLRRTQESSCTNFEILKSAVNRFHSTFESLLINAERARNQAAKSALLPTERASNARAARALHKLIENIKTVNATCAQKKVQVPK